MKSLAALLLTERKGEQAHREAVSMGLKYKGFGYWVDPSSGQVTHKTENDQLVAVEPDVESDKWNGPSGDQQMTPNPDARGKQVPGSFGAMQGNMQQAMGTGENVGTAEPGQELVPPEDKNAKWDPGPDGSTCVGSDAAVAPESPPQDSFVGKTNYYDWQAGPDGTNYKNLSYDRFLSHLKKPESKETPENPPEMGEMEQEQIIPMSYNMFIMEQGRVLPGEPDKIAASKNWTPDRFGWYRDGGGQVVARSIGGQMMVYDDQMPSHSGSGAGVDQGNPTVASGQTPADRARAAGLQSRGNGTYVNDAGQVGARTVNGELVFYDDGASGGAVTDGGGGQQMVQSQPSWVDPDSGLIIVPPSQPESPGEMAATPDPIPATTPHGYNSFIDKRHKEMKKSAQIQRDIESEVQDKQAQVDEVYASNPSMGVLKFGLEKTIEKAEASGDEYKIDIAARVRDLMNDNAEKYKEYFDTIPEEQHEELLDYVKKYTMQQAKQDWFENSGLADEFEPALKNNDDEKVQEVLSKQANGWGYQRKIDNMMDEALGVENVKSPTVLEKQRYSYSAGKYTEFNIKEQNPGASILDSGIEEYQRGRIKIAADKILRERGLKYKDGDKVVMADVTWGQRDNVPEGTDIKRISLDALSTWRQRALPRLKPGMILHNYPTGGGRGYDQRERIYKLAGFGSFSEEYQGMFAVVVPDENGNNTIVPIEFEKQVKEEISHKMSLSLTFIEEADASQLEDETINILYETLGL